MPVSGIVRASRARNGVSSFILPCKRLDFHYCDWAGSSRGMNAFLTSPHFSAFTSANPSIETSVSPRPHAHPIIRATYINGREKVVCVRNLESMQILRKAELLRDAGGEKLRRVTKVVGSLGGARGEGGVRGVWSGLHDIVGKEGGVEKGAWKRGEGAWKI